MRNIASTRVAIAAFASMILVGCGAEEPVVPPSLLGMWHSSKSGYEENAMEFTKDVVIFQAADDHFTVHPIKALEETREEQFERTRYDLVYSNEGIALETVLYHSDNGKLVFENQRGVAWRKDGVPIVAEGEGPQDGAR